MSIQWDDPERVAHFIRILEQESKAWHQAADAIESYLPGVSHFIREDVEMRMHECRARGEALRKLVRHICDGDLNLLGEPVHAR